MWSFEPIRNEKYVKTKTRGERGGNEESGHSDPNIKVMKYSLNSIGIKVTYEV